MKVYAATLIYDSTKPKRTRKLKKVEAAIKTESDKETHEPVPELVEAQPREKEFDWPQQKWCGSC